MRLITNHQLASVTLPCSPIFSKEMLIQRLESLYTTTQNHKQTDKQVHVQEKEIHKNEQLSNLQKKKLFKLRVYTLLHFLGKKLQSCINNNIYNQ